MRIEERAGQLEVENAALREQISQLLVFVAENVAIIAASRRQAMHWSASDRANARQATGGAADSLVMQATACR